MRYTIESVQVSVRYDDGRQVSWELNQDRLGDDCRMLLIGSDAYGAAGTHEKLEGPGLEAVGGEAPEDVSTLQPARPGAERPRSRGREDARTETRSYALSTTESSTTLRPETCIYKNGKWYCW